MKYYIGSREDVWDLQKNCDQAWAQAVLKGLMKKKHNNNNNNNNNKTEESVLLNERLQLI